MKKTFRKVIIGGFLFICVYFMLQTNVFAVVAKVKYGTDNVGPYLQMNTYYEKLVDSIFNKYYGVWADCYPMDSSGKKDYSSKRFVLFAGSVSGNNGGTEVVFDNSTYYKYYDIASWPTGNYACNSKVNISGYENDEGWYYIFHKNEQVTITIDGNGKANFSCPKDTYLKGSGKCVGKVSNNKEITLPSPTNKEFLGWYTTTMCTGTKYSAGTKVKVTSDITYFACYDKSVSPAPKPSTPTPAPKPSTPTPSVTKYTITLNGNGSKRFGCPTGFSDVPDSPVGICNGQVAKGSKFTLPTVDEPNFIGWTKNSNKDCSSNVVKGEQTVSGSQVYYACHDNKGSTGQKEMINAYMYLKEGAISGQPCSTQWYIQYCVGQTCYYCDPKGAKGTCNELSISRDKLSSTKADACTGSNTPGASTINDERPVAVSGSNYNCGDMLYITTCTSTTCTYTKVNGVAVTSGTVIRNDLRENSQSGKNTALQACKANKIDDDDKTCAKMNKLENQTGEGTYTLCYSVDATHSENVKKLEEYYQCADGYSFDKTSASLQGKEQCNSYICTGTYSVRCNKKSGVKPTANISPAIVGSNNRGVLTVKAKAYQGQINAYYVSEYFTAPTLSNSNWQEVNSSTFSIEGTPGTLYVWVRDTEGNISNVVTATIIDNNNSQNTLQKIALYDASGNIQTPSSSVSYNDSVIKGSKYVMMSNDLRNDSNVLADAFNPYNMEYKVDVASPTLAVYATLTSTDSKYVAGFEPRTVNLEYGTNTILIKIEDKEGKIRTYTILATRTDDRTSDNTLSDLKVSAGNIEFNANVTDYKIEIPSGTKTVDVTSTIASNVASYVNGYEPGKVEITGDTTIKLIKVISQTGSTRTYVLTFVKEKSDAITDKTLQLKTIVIPGVNMPFESEVSNYSISVEYDMNAVDIKPAVSDSESTYTLSRKRKTESSYVSSSNLGIPLDIGENFIEIKVQNNKGEISYYRITIIRKEHGLDISNDTTLKDLSILNHTIEFNPNKKEYTVRIKQEKTLVITAVPTSNRAEVFIRGNDELTGFSTVRVKVIAENGEFETYSIDIKKDPFNKTIEIAAIVVGCVIILGTSAILVINKKKKGRKEYFSE